MNHTAAADVEWSSGPAQNFTGMVRFGPLSRVEGGINAVAVEFEPGARTDWHQHPDGQVLYVASGSGLVQSEDGTTVGIRPGDVVYAPPGEVHWHGALPDSPMTHLSLTTGGATQWLPRKVTDEEYQARG